MLDFIRLLLFFYHKLPIYLFFYNNLCYNLGLMEVTKENIDKLEKRIKDLQIEYEQYFMKVIAKQPAVSRSETEKMMRTLINKRSNNTSFKFRLQSIQSRLITMKQYWDRTLRLIDEGKFVRHAEGGGFSSIKKKSVKARPQTRAVAPKRPGAVQKKA